MNIRSKSALKYTVFFFLGLLAGALLLESLEIYLRPAYRNIIIRTHLKTEQEFSASRASRENRTLEAVFHRWAVVNAESEDGFRVFRDQDNELDDNPYFYPLGMLALKSMASSTNVEKGKKVVEGIDRGKLAVALEALGQKEEAANQWQQAQLLMRHATLKATKDFVYSLLEQEKTDLHLKVEDKVLGKQKK